MNDLFILAAQNTVVALVLAICVFCLTRVWRNPPVAHVLWLVVLLKLVAPPIVPVERLTLRTPELAQAPAPLIAEVPVTAEQPAESHAPTVNPPIAEARVQNATQATAAVPRDVAPPVVQRHDFAEGLRTFWDWSRPIVLWIWLGGAVACTLVAVTRIVRFERRLRGMLPASERLQRLTAAIAGRLGIGRPPDVRYVESAVVPLLWSAGRRPTIVLPVRLLSQFDEGQVAMILAHELAHLRRRDHWVRGIELVVSALYWWNPLVWMIRRQIHQAEDLCCDAWVRWAFPDSTRDYAEVVLKAAESLGTTPIGARLLPASPFLHSLSLKARIEMILESHFAPRVSRRSMIAVALLALLVLPSIAETTKTVAKAESNDEAPAAAATAPAAKPNAQTDSEFPYVVKFEQGATSFADGDNITILEIRGTADTMAPGNMYKIRGTYTLASHDDATLAASTTAQEASDGTGPWLESQQSPAIRGSGTFTLFFPMVCKGWPHVSFYGGGESFGGNYFGNGESVLKQWWGAKSTTLSKEEKPNPAADSAFPYVVKFEQWETGFLEGDNITILEVRGTAATMTPGNMYWIKGTYKLNSHDQANVSAYVTATNQRDGKSRSQKAQSALVNRGDGTFTLLLPIYYPGRPHVSFYPAGGGQGFGKNYFGTGHSEVERQGNTAGASANSADNPHAPVPHDFSHVIRFEQGAIRFADGDEITISEVRGTTDTFIPGNTYQVKGTYTLASRDRAILKASATTTDLNLLRMRAGDQGIDPRNRLDLKARSDIFLPKMGRDPCNATGVEIKGQRTDVTQGTGTFTLILPMSFDGFPHVSFCSVEKGGASFGGNYFGTGGTVLEEWWKTD